MKYLIAILLCCIVCLHSSAKDKQEFYEIRVYHLQNKEQENRVDRYLKDALLPALHRQGYERVGVFKPVGNDTSSNKRVYVLIPYKKLEHFLSLEKDIQKDKVYLEKGADYINTAYNNPAYARIESILLQAFEGMPLGSKPGLKSPCSERIYELRSYESASEKIYANKVEMFNKGDEIGIFNKLGFNAVFYGEVLAGCTKPNLMYMTSFENMEERDKHWKTFGSDPAWKALSSKPEYKNNVSKHIITFLQATDYSDL
ncbi:NIPSNAP family protein [Chitinophagaceae bacterium LB-8]|uniref:NIPSNAP family protein n=1 Tax=Paraflavisolibacter caeni TaxID=2982496 RepID=A0A9X2XX12_9BACT|nr:NIPSNAP family protein [Paraflavisolibacter caeni]MCU7550841.1 NIPSNAP family protein [Paraflavisolibacter caeni]